MENDNEYWENPRNGAIVHKGITSEISDAEKRLIALANDAVPLTKKEKIMQNEIRDIKAAGMIIEVPSM